MEDYTKMIKLATEAIKDKAKIPNQKLDIGLGINEGIYIHLGKDGYCAYLSDIEILNAVKDIYRAAIEKIKAKKPIRPFIGGRTQVFDPKINTIGQNKPAIKQIFGSEPGEPFPNNTDQETRD